MAITALSLDEIEFRQRPGEVNGHADHGRQIMSHLTNGKHAEEVAAIIRFFTEDDSTAQAINA